MPNNRDSLGEPWCAHLKEHNTITKINVNMKKLIYY